MPRKTSKTWIRFRSKGSSNLILHKISSRSAKLETSLNTSETPVPLPLPTRYQGSRRDETQVRKGAVSAASLFPA
eukprot:scaffold5241_cov95-Pinguiococcus_pyrenoidosus.AAC.1